MQHLHGLCQNVANQEFAAMMSFQKARFALWNHPSTTIREPIEWRETPKSKDYVAVVPPTVLPGDVTVAQCNSGGIQVFISDDQAEALELWMQNVPEHVIAPTAISTKCIASSDVFVCYDKTFRATNLHPTVDETVRVRLTAYVTRIGNMRKTQLSITDVLRNNVAV